MPFYLYRKTQQNGQIWLEQVRQVPLAGQGVIRDSWRARGKPLNKGWHVPAAELAERLRHESDHEGVYTLVIDLIRAAGSRIELLELLDIYAYTYARQSNQKVWWTPLMLRLRDLFIEDSPRKLTSEQKAREIASFAPNVEGQTVFEFLYLQGDDGKWTWGPVGSVNGALLRQDAREYFKTLFCE